MRPIDADALKDHLQSLAYDDWNQGVSTSWADAYRECADMVDEQPTVHPEPESENELPRRTRWCHHCEFGYVDVNDYPCSDCDAMNVPIHFKPKEGAEQE